MRKYRIFALVLCLCLLLALLPAGALAAEDVIHISTPSELRALAEKCRLDSWSVGKTVIIECDIDFSDAEFVPIPSFGGVFDGGGHSLTGIELKGDGSAVGGFFRFVQAGAIVKNMNVEGRIEPEMNAESFGGIAGENHGTITGCTFSGTVSGSVEIGGIVGCNGSEGLVEDCRSLAAVSGEHYTGGIAGRNMGSIVRCANLGPINTTNPELAGEELDIDWEHINSSENVAAHTDTGGITGYSNGTLDNCVNRGNVGYAHVGYNVGGIAGRQSGFVDSCRNFGIVNGRKDVGGVVGQMVPSIELQLTNSALDQLNAEMDTLQSLLNELINDVQGSSNEISDILSDASAYLDSAGQSAGALGDALTGFIDGNIESMNGLLSSLQTYIGRMESVIDYLGDCVDYLGAAGESIGAALEVLEAISNDTEIREGLEHAYDKFSTAADQLSGAIGMCSDAVEELEAYLEKMDADGMPGPGEMEEAYDEFVVVASSVAGKLRTALDLAGSALENMEDGTKNGLVPAMERAEMLYEDGNVEGLMKNAFDNVENARYSMSLCLNELEKCLGDLSREDFNDFESLGEDFVEEADRMEAALVGLSGQMEKLNTAVNGSVNTMADDLRAVNDQFFKVMDCFAAMLEGPADTADVYEDMSEEELFSATDGKVQKSENRGAVSGDVNIGGLVGAVGIEYDLDPEEDVSVSGSSEGTFKYFTRAILLESVNFEGVNGKKDCVGGAVGYMDLGVVYGCENYGDISSVSGDYVGGIAGQSSAALRNCWSLCSVSGRDYVGGIAGTVDDVSGCRSLVRVNATGGWKGAIAGEVAGEAKDNFFVDDAGGGIDGVSYAGRAEPQSYAEFISAEDVPGEFKNFRLTFATDSVTVKSINFNYGKSIDLTEIPNVPERVGYVGQWEHYDFTNLRFSDTIHAVYTPYDTVIAVQESVGKRSLLLLEGSFIPGATPYISPCAEAPEGSLEAWNVSCTGLVEQDYTMRYLKPETKAEIEILVLMDGGWQNVEYREEGSYLLFDGSGSGFSFAVMEIERDFPVTTLALCIGAGAVLVIVVLIMYFRAGRKKKAKAA